VLRLAWALAALMPIANTVAQLRRHIKAPLNKWGFVAATALSPVALIEIGALDLGKQLEFKFLHQVLSSSVELQLANFLKKDLN